MKTTIITIVVILLISIFAFFLLNSGQNTTKPTKQESPAYLSDTSISPTTVQDDISSEFIQCLADAGIVIYGMSTCPACADLVNRLGGTENLKPIYIECNENQEICDQEQQSFYVPEVQLNGEVFENMRTPQQFADITGCDF